MARLYQATHFASALVIPYAQIDAVISSCTGIKQRHIRGGKA